MFKKKPDKESPKPNQTVTSSQTWVNSIEVLGSLLMYLDKQAQLIIQLGQIPTTHLYIIDLIHQTLMKLLGGDRELITTLGQMSSEMMVTLLKAVQQLHEGDDSSKNLPSNFEELMKGLNIKGINIQGTGEPIHPIGGDLSEEDDKTDHPEKSEEEESDDSSEEDDSSSS